MSDFGGDGPEIACSLWGCADRWSWKALLLMGLWRGSCKALLPMGICTLLGWGQV